MQEASQEARNCLILYEPTRDEILRAAHWNFARKTAQLTLLKAAPGTPEFIGTVPAAWNPTLPAPPWLYEYAYPDDCVKARYIVPSVINTWPGPVPLTSAPAGPMMADWSGAWARFIIATSVDGAGNQRTVVLTNQSQAILVYTMLVTNPDLWDPQFERAMVSALAARLVLPLSGDKSLRKLQEDLTMQKINQARVTDGNEGPVTTNTTPEWIQARGTSGFWPGYGYYMLGWDNPSFLS